MPLDNSHLPLPPDDSTPAAAPPLLPMLPADFVRDVQAGIEVHGRVIQGNVSLRGIVLAHPVTVHDCRFEDAVDLRNSRCESGLDLSRCKFARTLTLADARVHGSLLLNDIVVLVDAEPVLFPGRLTAASARLKQGARRRAGLPQLDAETRRRLITRALRSQTGSLRRLRAARGSGAGVTIALDLENLRVDGCMSVMDARIGGTLSGRHMRVDGDLCLEGTRLAGDMMLRHATLGELRTDARSPERDPARGKPRPFQVAGTLDFASALVSTDLRLVGAVVGQDVIGGTATVDGNVIWKPGHGFRTQVRGSVLLPTLKVRGSLVVEGARFGGEFNFQGGSTGGNLQLIPHGAWRTEIAGQAWMIGASVTGAVELLGTNVGADLVLQNATVGQSLLARTDQGHHPGIGGDAWLLGITVSDAIDLSGAEVGRNVVLDNAQVGNIMAKVIDGRASAFHGDISLEGAEVVGPVTLLGVDVDGNLELSGARIGGGLNVAFDLVSIDDWTPRRATVGGRLRAEAATIGKAVVLMGLDVSAKRAHDEYPASERGVNFVGSRINGEVQLYSETHVGDVIRDKLSEPSLDGRRRVLLDGALRDPRAVRTRIWGDLRLTRAHVLGNVMLEGVQILGDLDLRDVHARANVSCRAILLPKTGMINVEAWRADFETLDVTGDVDLTGLTIRRRTGAAPPDLVLRDATVRGRVELWPYDAAADTAPFASVEGALHLEAASISHLVVSGRNLHGNVPPGPRRREGGERQDPRLALERAKIDRFQIVGPLPGLVDLSHLRVDRWQLSDEDPRQAAASRWRRAARGATGSAIAEERKRYLELLECSMPFKRSNYLAMEHAVRNAGEEELADRIHVLMRRRDRENKSVPGAIGDWLLERSIGYGTTIKPLLLAMAVSFAACVFVFRDRGHVEWDTLPVARSAPGHVAIDEWGWKEAALLATHYHVPIISLGVEDHVRPSGPGLRAYAMATTALSWVMWPLLIASMSGLLRRRE